ncbi:MAG: N-acetylmuramoyl-L-alanine amidase [Eubacterium sp.]
MKKIILIVMVFSLTVAACFGFNKTVEKNALFTSLNRKSGISVVIDAGHGGKDGGAIGYNNNYEKDINLSIALMLYDFMIFSGCNAVLVRNGDYEIYKDGEERNRSDLYNRLDFVNSIENSVLISIHQNHFDNEAEWGSQVWYSANTAESKIMADSIQESIVEFLQPDNERLNKESDSSYYLLYKASVPSVMVECGFISNREENIKLQDESYQANIAYSIMVGFNGVDFNGEQV